MAELRGGGSSVRHIEDPLSTVTASGNHHMLVRGESPTPASAADTAPRVPDINECRFRMLTPGEVGAAMAFRSDYEVQGTKRDKVKQLGNAVTPPAAEWLLRAVANSLNSLS